MLACRIHAKDDLRVESQEMPAVGPGEVLLKLGAGGICGSDMHYFFEGRNGSFVVREPLIPGHEASGTVAEIGPGVTRVAVGDKVAISPSHACGRCSFCRQGREQLCEAMRFLGSASVFPHVQGMFRDYFVMAERQCYPVEADVSLGELAFAEPLAVALHAVNRGGGLLGKSVLITGAGTIGCLTVLAARLAGAASVTVSDILDRPLAQAKIVGADVTLHAVRDAGALTRPQFDVAYEVSGSIKALTTCVAAVKRGGTDRAGGHAAGRTVAVRRQRPDGEGARFARRIPLGHRIRLGGRLPGIAPRRRAAAVVGPISADRRRRRVSCCGRQESQHQGSARGELTIRRIHRCLPAPP